MTDFPGVPLKDNSRPITDKINRKQPEVDLLEIVAGSMEPFNRAQGEQALWRAVILQALLDAVSRSGKEEANRHRQQACRWLAGKSDFDEVCHLAGYAPTYVRRQVKDALARDRQRRISSSTEADEPAGPSGVYTPPAANYTNHSEMPARARPAWAFLVVNHPRLSGGVAMPGRVPSLTSLSCSLGKIPH